MIEHKQPRALRSNNLVLGLAGPDQLPPELPRSVDRAAAGDGDVFGAYRLNKRPHRRLTQFLRLGIVLLVLAAEQRCASFDFQRDMTSQRDGTSQKGAGSKPYRAASARRASINRLLHGPGVFGCSICLCSIMHGIADQTRCAGEKWLFHRQHRGDCTG